MYSAKGITQVIIDDKPNTYYEDDETDKAKYISGDIILGVSNGDAVYYDWFEGILERQKEDKLFLDNYHGKILIPKHCGLQIIDSQRRISGLINFPAYLDSCSDMNIMIDKNSGLELLVESKGDLHLNGQEITGLMDPKDDGCKFPKTIGKNFIEYEGRYTRICNKTMKNPQFITDQYGSTVDFGEYSEHNPIQICMKYNIVALNVEFGNVNIYYEGVTPEKESYNSKLFRDIRRMESSLENAKRFQNFELAAKLSPVLNKLYSRREHSLQKNPSNTKKIKDKNSHE
jgi:hypothetical protein